MKSIVLGAALALALPVGASATAVVDYSDTISSGNRGSLWDFRGYQFLNTTTFTVDHVEVLMGLPTAGATFTLSLIEFGDVLPDKTATAVLGSVEGVVSKGVFASFDEDAISVDFSAQDIVFEAGTVYGIVASAASNGEKFEAGTSRTSNVQDDTFTLHINSDGLLNYNVRNNFDSPFVIYNDEVSAVPLPAPLALLGAGLAGLGVVARRRKG